MPYLTFSAITQSHGRANREAHIAWAPSLAGPWSWPLVMVRHGGQNSVFEGPAGKFFASFSGADPCDPDSNYGNPFPNDPSFILPIHFAPAANPPVIRHIHEMPMIGRAVYEP